MYDGRIKPFVPAIVWAAVIFCLSSIPNLSTPSFGFEVTDKIAHFGEFFILGLLVSYSIGKRNLSLRKIFWISASISGFYGILDELHQLYVPGRQVDGFDMLADVLGATSASGLYVLKLRKRNS